MSRPVALPLGELIAQPDVGEGAPYHHLVVAAPRPVAVELGALDAMLNQVAPCGAVRGDAPGGGDVVSGNRVPQDDQRPSSDDLGQGLRRVADVFEEGG